MTKKEIIQQLNEASNWIYETSNGSKEPHIAQMLEGIENATNHFLADKIEIDIAYYHPEDAEGNEDETIKVFDFEGMAEEFENELSKLDDSVVVMCSVENI